MLLKLQQLILCNPHSAGALLKATFSRSILQQPQQCIVTLSSSLSVSSRHRGHRSNICERMESDKLLFVDEKHADVYAKYRPLYPTDLHQAIVDYCKAGNLSLDLALDIGCGSGQNTLDLGTSFKKVIGSDVSEAQINQAKKLYGESHPNIDFRVNSAEDLSDIEDGTVDLTTFATCFHWLDAEKVYAEMRRVLKPGGVMAVYTKGLVYASLAEASEVIRKFDGETLKGYFSPRKQLLENKYRDITLPFRDFVRDEDSFKMHYKMPLSSLLGYLESWSGWQQYNKEHPGNTELEDVGNAIRKVYQKDTASNVHDIEVEVYWPVYLLMGRN